MRVEAGIKPMAVVAFGIFVLCLLDTAMKELLQGNSTGLIVLMRYASGSFWSVLLFLALRERFPSPVSIRSNLARAFVVAFTAFTFFYAMGRLPFAETIAITFTSPIFIALLGRAVLKEAVGGPIVLALVLGSAGVVVILSGRLTVDHIDAQALEGIIAALLSAIGYALATVLMRRQTARDSMVTIVALQNVFAAMIMAPIGIVQWVTPGLREIGLALCAGLLGTIGHCCMAWGYARAEAARLGALEYTAFIWAALLGWAFFSETPSATVALGALLIIGGAVVANWGRRGRAPAAVEDI